MLKLSLKLTAKTLVLLLIPAVFLFIGTNYVNAAVGLSVGNTGLNLLQAENLFYGNVGSTSHASSSFLLFQNNSVDRLRIDILGNLTTSGAITAGAFSGPITGGSISAANVSAGNFGSNVGNGNFSFPGSLGIGTASPDAKVNVFGTIGNGSISPQEDLLHVGGNELGGVGGYAGIRIGGTADSRYYNYIRSVKTTNYGNYWNSDLAFGVTRTGTASTSDEVMRITSGSNVGIGTTNPSAQLHQVINSAGNILYHRIQNIDTTNSSSGAGIFIQPTSGSWGSKIWTDRGGTGSAFSLKIGVSNSADPITTPRVTIKDDGNVGIGTTNPTAKLYVNGTSIFNDVATFTQPVVVSAPILGPHAATKSYVDSTIASATSSITLWGGTAGGNIWKLNSGNVGIGTNNPQGLLSLYSSGNNVIRLSNSGTNFPNSGTIDFLEYNNTFGVDDYGFRFTFNGLDNKFYIQSAGGGASSTLMTINRDGGNVGLGTTNPSSATLVIATSASNYSLDAGNYRIGNVATPVSANDAVNLTYLQSAVGAAQNAYWNLSGSTLSASSTTWNVRVGTTTAGTDKIGVAGGRISTLDTSDIYAGGQVNSAGTGASAFAGRLAVGQIAAATPKFFVNGGAAIGTNYSTANIATGTMALETNLGIGLTNPTARVHIFDTTTTTGYNSYLYNNGITSGTMLGLVQASSTFSGIGLYMNFQSGTGTSTANFADFRINNSQRFAVNYRGGITSTYASDTDNVNLNNFSLTSGNASAGSYNALAAAGTARLIVSQVSATEDELFDNNYEGFKFNSGTYNNMGGFYIRMRRGATTPVNVGAYFRAHIYTDNGGQPGTNVTNSPSIYVARLGTAYADYYFPLSVALTANTNYWILLYKVGGFNAADQVYFYTHPTSGSAEWAYGNGTSWSVDPTRRGYFRVYSRSANGITATSDVSYGIYGSSTFGTGVRGASNAGIGVYGVSTHGYGGQFDSGLGLYNIVNGPSASAIYNFTTLQRTGQRFLDYTYNLGYIGDIFNINSGSNVYTVHYLYYNGSAFTDYTNTARNFGGSAYPLLADSDDYFYFGRSSATTSYRNLFFDISNTPNLSGVTWEYASGADGSNNCIWTPFTPTTDETNGLLRDGMVTPGSMSLAACTVNGIASRYWMRVRASSVTTGVNAYASSFGYFGGYFARYYSSDIERFRMYNNGTTYAAGPIYPGTTDAEDGVQTSRYIYDAGTLGIGLNTSLNVSGTATFTQPIIVGAPIVATHAATKSYVDGLIGGATSTGLWTLSGSNLFASSTSWNVGIGTAAPVSKFTVFGANPRLSITHNVLNAGDTGIDFILNPTMTVERKNAIIVNAAGSYGRGNMFFVLDSASDSNNYDIAADTKMTILNNGNVGIGTTNPTSKFFVSHTGSTGVVGTLSFANTNNDYTRLQVLSNGAGFTLSGHSGGGGYITGTGALNFSNNDVANAGTMWLGNGNRLRLVNSAATETYFLINTAGNVGIGTTTLAAKLSVSGGNAFINDAAITSGTPKAAITKEYLDSALAVTQSAYWNLSGSNLFASSTSWNVGIGTTSPTEKLHIYTTTNAHPTIESSSASSYLTLLIKNSIQTWQLGFHGDSGNFRIRNGTSGAYPLVIATSSNIGIGTTNPLKRLQVAQDLAYSQSQSGQLYLSSADGVKRLMLGYDSTNNFGFIEGVNFGTSYSDVVINPVQGNVGIGTTTPAAKLSVSGGNAFINDAAITSGTPKAAITKEYLDSALAVTQSAYWNLSGSNLFASSTSWNVGIGTASPGGKLEIKTASNDVLKLNRDGWVGGEEANILFSHNGTYNAKIGSWVEGGGSMVALRFFTVDAGAQSQKMVIRGNGNVGIGTTNPSSKLNVIAENDGDGIVIRRNAATDGNYADLRFSLTTSDTYNGATFIRTYRGPGGSGDNDMLFNVGGNNALMIKDSGKIGIGTTTPDSDKMVTIWGGNLILKDAIIGAGSDAQLAATKGYVDSVINALPSGIASFVTSTPVAYNGSRGGYSGANALCSALVAGSHVCTAEEILQTINSGATANIPTSTTLWINNGPPGYTVNANDCIGWTNADSSSFAPVWVKLASGDGFGALDRCNSTRRYACCK